MLGYTEEPLWLATSKAILSITLMSQVFIDTIDISVKVISCLVGLILGIVTIIRLTKDIKLRTLQSQLKQFQLDEWYRKQAEAEAQEKRRGRKTSDLKTSGQNL